VRSQHACRQNHDRNEERNPQVELHTELPSLARPSRPWQR
jgi:hypothetical protein